VAEAARIPLFRPRLAEEAAERVAEVLASGWLGLGPRTREFEEAFAGFLGMPHCVGTSSCSGALQLALTVLDLPPGTEVVTSALTFVGANEVIVQAGLVPVYADIDPRTGNLAPGAVAEALSDATGALVLLHYGGYPCDLDELHALATERGLPVVEDCAHACGARYKGRRVGSHGDLHAFSFHAVKNLPMGEGGALVVRSPELAERLRRLRWFGIDSDTHARFASDAKLWEYDVTELGFKLQMDDVHAAIGLVQLARLDEDNARRAELVARYRAGLAGVPGIELPHEEPDRQSSHHLCWVLAERRDELARKLAARGIGTSVHYKPSYAFPALRGEPLPGVESFWSRTLSLPLHLDLRDEDVDRIVATIAEGW
jgi:perosamine synthetase